MGRLRKLHSAAGVLHVDDFEMPTFSVGLSDSELEDVPQNNVSLTRNKRSVIDSDDECHLSRSSPVNTATFLSRKRQRSVVFEEEGTDGQLLKQARTQLVQDAITRQRVRFLALAKEARKKEAAKRRKLSRPGWQDYISAQKERKRKHTELARAAQLKKAAQKRDLRTRRGDEDYIEPATVENYKARPAAYQVQ